MGWIKTLGDKEYIQVEPTVFGPYTIPNIDKITILPNLGVSPPKGRTLKRTRDSPETVKIPSKHQTLTIDDLMLQPSWRNTDKSPTAKTPLKTPTTSPIKTPTPHHPIPQPNHLY